MKNSLEMMPWEFSLNKQDLKDAVMQHVCYMYHLSKDDDHKFSLPSPVVALGPSAKSWSTKMALQAASESSRILVMYDTRTEST
jgi:hypothetical protein